MIYFLHQHPTWMALYIALLCWCAVKKLLTHSLSCEFHGRLSIFAAYSRLSRGLRCSSIAAPSLLSLRIRTHIHVVATCFFDFADDMKYIIGLTGRFLMQWSVYIAICNRPTTNCVTGCMESYVMDVQFCRIRHMIDDSTTMICTCSC